MNREIYQQKLSAISARLRAEREKAFYGDTNFIPSEEYNEVDGRNAIGDAGYVFSIAESIIH